MRKLVVQPVDNQDAVQASYSSEQKMELYGLGGVGVSAVAAEGGELRRLM